MHSFQIYRYDPGTDERPRMQSLQIEVAADDRMLILERSQGGSNTKSPVTSAPRGKACTLSAIASARVFAAASRPQVPTARPQAPGRPPGRSDRP